MNSFNPLENVQKILKKSCEILNLDDSVYDLLKEQREAGKIIVIASHIENNFNYDSIITMNEGKISNVK